MSDIDLDDPSAAAEARRQEAYDTCDQHTWRGQRLTPWSLRLQRVHDRLRVHDAPPPAKLTAETYKAWVPYAAQILYLCSVDRLTVWQALMPDPRAFLLAVEAWAEENIPVDEEVDAVLLALKLVNEHLQMQPIHRPGRREGRPVGESPSPSAPPSIASSSPGPIPP